MEILYKIKPEISYIYKKHILCYDQILINIKFNKLKNYKRHANNLLEIDVNNKYNILQLLEDINICIYILEPLIINTSDISLLDIDLEIDNKDDNNDN